MQKELLFVKTVNKFGGFKWFGVWHQVCNSFGCTANSIKTSKSGNN